MSEYVFVYGTLKRGFCRAHYMQGARFIDTARTEPGYLLFDVGEYPALVRHETGQSVQGELYEVEPDLWPILDEVEGVAADLYRRLTVQLEAPHDELRVETYLYRRSITGLRRCGSHWP
ncbi:gamma-glutamylcyclotransferase family protein [Rubinisphaera margarita]|uniref:gamma-glutamylcyclotransferase family protein n=1 Tax=Rubinisphaera margarita TaxID=2909586 RepID=UPI001EE94C50|nr:gamma-glutamylcyclotransferase family protein [Rubinisphaera margarita]MCG6155215.1 gamma-glutamylcyclotransferase [Rubinisphaera margarita]